MLNKLALLSLCFILSACATAPMTTRALKQNEVALGLTVHFSPERNQEAATGFWFGYGFGNEVDIFFDASTLVYPYYVYKAKLDSDEQLFLPNLTIRFNMIDDRNYFFGVSNYSGNVYEKTAFSHTGMFAGVKLKHKSLAFSETLFMGYQRKGSVDEEIYKNGFFAAFKNSLSSNKDLGPDDKDSFHNLELSVVPEFWLRNNRISYKDMIYQLNYEIVEKDKNETKN